MTQFFHPGDTVHDRHGAEYMYCGIVYADGYAAGHRVVPFVRRGLELITEEPRTVPIGALRAERPIQVVPMEWCV